MSITRPTQFLFRPARPDDAADCVAMRGKTRQNAYSEEQLRAVGVTRETWKDGIQSGSLPGHVCISDGTMVGYCFGDHDSGEIVVLAVLPDFENCGVGRELLDRTVRTLVEAGHRRLFLACSPYPESRSHGFYRHLGWRSTETYDSNGDEILELIVTAE